MPGGDGEQSLLHGIMHAGAVDDRVNTGLAELSLNIFGGHVAVVAAIAILFFCFIVQEPLLAAGAVGIVAVLTAIAHDGCFARVRPGIRAGPIPGFH